MGDSERFNVCSQKWSKLGCEEANSDSDTVSSEGRRSFGDFRV